MYKTFTMMILNVLDQKTLKQIAYKWEIDLDIKVRFFKNIETCMMNIIINKIVFKSENI